MLHLSGLPTAPWRSHNQTARGRIPRALTWTTGRHCGPCASLRRIRARGEQPASCATVARVQRCLGPLSHRSEQLHGRGANRARCPSQTGAKPAILRISVPAVCAARRVLYHVTDAKMAIPQFPPGAVPNRKATGGQPSQRAHFVTLDCFLHTKHHVLWATLSQPLLA